MRPGETIAGRYEIVRSVRSGGLSVVFQAADRRTGQTVAVKIINIGPSEEALLKRIEREIKILTSLSHPHVVACLGGGALPDGRPYLILEWLEGEDLADFKGRAPMTLRRVLEVAGQIADALSAAHTLGIIHRDIKPANIYLVRPEVDARPDSRLIDFGVAKLPQANAAITRAGAILGTPSYMAPEQASYAMDVDARADLFSLGVVTYELLTGRLPWQATTDLARLARILIEPAIPVHEVSADVPNSVAELIDSMLRLRPADRIASARTVHDRVLQALRELPHGVLDTTFTRDADLLSSFVSEDTADVPVLDPNDPKLAAERSRALSDSTHDMRTEGIQLGPEALNMILEVHQNISVEDVRDSREQSDTQEGGRRGSSARRRSRAKSNRKSVVTETPTSPPMFPGKEHSEPTQVLEAPPAPSASMPQVRTATPATPPAAVKSPAPVAPPMTPKSGVVAAVPSAGPKSGAMAAIPSASPKSAAMAAVPSASPSPAPPPRPPDPVRPPSLRKSFDERLSYVEGSEPVLFGRVQELDALRSSVMRALNTERPSYTIVVGPAGIGKTRIRVELTKLVRGSAKPPHVFAGRAEETGRSSPFAFLRRMLLAEARIHSDDPPEVKRTKMLELVPSGPEIRRLLNNVEPPVPGFESLEEGEGAARTHFSVDELWSERPSMVSVLRDAFGTIARDPSRDSRDSKEDRIDRDEDRATLAGFLCQALHIPYPEIPPLASARSDPRLMGDQVCRALDIVLRHLAKKRGLVAIIDDAHFLDHLSAFVLRNLVAPARGERVVLVVFALPNVLDSGTSRSPLAAGSDVKLLELEPLDARASREFARSLVKGVVESAALEHLVKRAAGNPLYLEQLVRAVLATGVLALSEGGELELKGLAGNATDDDRIPPTVAAAVAARVMKMRHELQKVLTAAAVFGDVFWIEGVAKLLGDNVEETTLLLDVLLLDNLVRRRAASRYRRQTEMEFTHAVIRSVALSRLKRKRRHKLERLAVEYLEAAGEDDEATLAQHAAHMGKIEQAAILYADAADESLSLGSVASASALADEGLLLTEGGGAEPATRRRLLDLAERIAVLGGQYDTAIDALDALEGLASSREDVAQLRERSARVAFAAHRYEQAAVDAEAAIAIWKEAKSEEGEASARVAHAEACEARGDGRSALRGFIAAHSVFAAKGHAGGLARTTRGLARIAVSSGDYRTAENRFRESLVHSQSTRDPMGSFLANLGLADVSRLTGHAAKAAEHLDDAVRAASTVERHLAIEAERARVACDDSRPDDAKKLIDRAWKAVVARPELGEMRRVLALVRAQVRISTPGADVARAELAEMRETLEAALESAKLEEPSLVVALQSSLALTHALSGRNQEALALDREAVDRFIGEGAVVRDEPPWILHTHARVLQLTGAKKEEVRAAWKTAIEHLDSIASRLDRKMRKHYLDRPIARAVIAGAEKAGLKLSRDATSNRIAASET